MESLNNYSDATKLNASNTVLEAIAEQNPTETAFGQYVEPNEEQPVNTAVMIPGCVILPSVQNQSEEALAEPTNMAETMLSNAKMALKHTNSPDDLKNHEGTCKTAIYLNSWLLYREVQRIENVKADIKAGKYPSYNKAWEEHKLSRKKWASRKDITFEMVEKATNESLEKLEAGDCWDIDDLPTMYRLNQSLHPVVEPENDTFTILEPGETPQFDMPENAKFQVIYGDLTYKIGIEEMRNYIAEDAVGFFWIDNLQVQKSLDILKNLRFTVKEFAVTNIGKSHGGIYTTREHRTMAIVSKGNAPKPTDLKIASVVFDREIENTDKRPLYYAEIIQQMYPNFPVLEIHSENFKYLNQNYLITELKGDNHGTK